MTVISHNFHMNTEMHEYVTNITRTEALSGVLNAVSAICWGSFSDLWFPMLTLKYFSERPFQVICYSFMNAVLTLVKSLALP